ncbi:uncharacterized protein [Haliotis cracherodii]|uniref:uncharacterized protein n=1 Tax=Haliotis cracherodii TaxID=6455 RepID=UPI0039E83853
MIPKSLFVSVGIDTDLERTLTPSTSQTLSLTLLSLSKQQGSVISSAPVIQDVWESPSRSVWYASRDVSISRYISTTPVLPTSTLTPSSMDSTPSPGSESSSDTIRGLSGLKVQSPVWSDPSSSGPTYLQSPFRSSVSSVGFSSLITSQEMDSTVVGDFLEQSASSRSVIVKGTETPLIFTSMRSRILESSHPTNHPDMLYSISTSALISTQETATFDQGLATDGDSGITGVESETIGSSTTDNGDLLHPTSESVIPSSTKRQPPSDTTTAPMIAAAPSEAVMSSITNSSYIYTCSSYYSENEASSCPCLRMLTNAVASSCHASSGASVVLTCKVGWGFPEGQSNLTVQCWDATWTPEPLHCVPGGSSVSFHYSYLAGFFKQRHFHNDRHLRY